MMYDYNSDDMKYTEIAILMETTNKYHPGKKQFYLQALTPGQPKTIDTTKENVNTNNLQNLNDKPQVKSIESNSTIILELPKEVTRWFPVKWIPPGTRFIVSFIGGDLTKPMIIGRDYDDYSSVQQS